MSDWSITAESLIMGRLALGRTPVEKLLSLVLPWTDEGAGERAIERLEAGGYVTRDGDALTTSPSNLARWECAAKRCRRGCRRCDRR